jgi:hypothetical protein
MNPRFLLTEGASGKLDFQSADGVDLLRQLNRDCGTSD